MVQHSTQSLTPSVGVRDCSSERQQHLDHLVTSEKTYIAGLQTLLDDYGTPLRAVLTSEEWALVFDGIGAILRVSRELLRRLRRSLRDAPDGSGLAGEFVQIAPFLRVHSTFAVKYEASGGVLATASRRAKVARVLTPDFEATLRSLLVTPIQRVPRYALLLRDLAAYSDAGTPQIAISKAIESIERIASDINLLLSVDKSKQAVHTVQQAVRDCPLLVEPHRVFVAIVGPVWRPIQHVGLRRGLGFKERWLIVFSDAVMVCGGTYNREGIFYLSPTQPLDLSHSSLYFKDMISLRHACVRTLVEHLSILDDGLDLSSLPSEDLDTISRSVVLRGTGSSHILTLEHLSIHSEVYKMLADLEERGRKARTVFEREVAARTRLRSPFIPDRFTVGCMLCRASMKKKLHCPVCGRIVCSRCTVVFEGVTRCQLCHIAVAGVIEEINPLRLAMLDLNKITSVTSPTLGIKKRRLSAVVAAEAANLHIRAISTDFCAEAELTLTPPAPVPRLPVPRTSCRLAQTEVPMVPSPVAPPALGDEEEVTFEDYFEFEMSDDLAEVQGEQSGAVLVSPTRPGCPLSPLRQRKTASVVYPIPVNRPELALASPEHHTKRLHSALSTMDLELAKILRRRREITDRGCAEPEAFDLAGLEEFEEVEALRGC